jgi:hypothetical protein
MYMESNLRRQVDYWQTQNITFKVDQGSFDFDEQEIARIGELAKDLRSILTQAKQRQQEKIGQYK